MKTKYRPQVGDERWIVEWCAKVAWLDDDHHEYGQDLDNNVYKRRLAATREEALKVAAEVLPVAQENGSDVAFWPATYTAHGEEDQDLYPGACYWEETADTEYYDGES